MQFLFSRMEEKCRWNNMTRLTLEGCPLLLLKKQLNDSGSKNLKINLRHENGCEFNEPGSSQRLKNEILNQRS